VRDKRSCSSVRDCWAAVRSDRTAARVSCSDWAASSWPGPGPGPLLDGAGEDGVRGVSGRTTCTERSARRVSVLAKRGVVR
jgi:hypothetical protein